MANISFAWTTPALLAGVKRVTRRDWPESYARRFRRGQTHAAWDRNPRYRGSQVGLIALTADPVFSAELPPEDFDLEGFGLLSFLGLKVDGQRPEVMWRAWRMHAVPQWIVRFELVDRTPEGERQLAAVAADVAAWREVGGEIERGVIVRDGRVLKRFNDFPSHRPLHERSFDGGRTWETWDPFEPDARPGQRVLL